MDTDGQTEISIDVYNDDDACLIKFHSFLSADERDE